MKAEDLLSMLAVQDKQDEEQKKEKVEVRTRSFNPVLRIVEIIEKHPGVINGNENYFELLTNSFLTINQTTEHLLTDLNNLGISAPKDIAEKAQKDLGGFVSLLSRDLRDKLDKTPKTKVPTLPGKDYSKERKDSYQTSIGMFLPQDTDALIAANHIKRSLNGLEGVLERVGDIESLSRLLLLDQLVNLASEPRKIGIYREISGIELSEDALMYVVLSLEKETNALSQIRRFRGLSVARAKASKSVKSRIKKVARMMDYRQRAEELVYKIYQSTRRINISYQNVSDKKSFDEFIKVLESKIMIDDYRAFKPENKGELNSGRAILVRTMKGLKSGTLGELVSGQFKPSKGNTINIGCKDVVKIQDKSKKEKLRILDEIPKVGDLVVMLKSANHQYSCSKEGSWGYLQEIITQDTSYITFHHITGDPTQLPQTWTIFNHHFKKAVFEDGKKQEVYTPETNNRVKAKQERIKKKQLKVERNRIRKIINQSLEEIASSQQEQVSEVKGCIEHLVKLGITPETANLAVKHYITSHSLSYANFVDQGALMPDKESNKQINRIKQLVNHGIGDYKSILKNIIDDIARETQVFIDISQLNVKNEKDLVNLRDKLGEFYYNGYVKNGKEITKPGLAIALDGEFKGLFGEIREFELCRGCYHFYIKDLGKTHVRPNQLVPVKPADFGNATRFIKGARIRLREDGERAGQNPNVGILQEDYKTDDEGQHCKIVFEDGYMNFYRKQDLRLLTNDENHAHVLRNARPKLYAIFDRHFKQVNDAVAELEALRSNLKSEIESLGLNPEAFLN